MTLDELLPLVESTMNRGAVVLLKWDGQRRGKQYTVVITHPPSDYVFHRDSKDLAATLWEGLSDYEAAHPS